MEKIFGSLQRATFSYHLEEAVGCISTFYYGFPVGIHDLLMEALFCFVVWHGYPFVFHPILEFNDPSFFRRLDFGLDSYLHFR